jgi:hypothetical protein
MSVASTDSSRKSRNYGDKQRSPSLGNANKEMGFSSFSGRGIPEFLLPNKMMTGSPAQDESNSVLPQCPGVS